MIAVVVVFFFFVKNIVDSYEIVTSLFGVVFSQKYIRYKLRQYRGVMLVVVFFFLRKKYCRLI